VALHAWRDEQARQRDESPQFIMQERILIDVVLREGVGVEIDARDVVEQWREQDAEVERYEPVVLQEQDVVVDTRLHVRFDDDGTPVETSSEVMDIGYQQAEETFTKTENRVEITKRKASTLFADSDDDNDDEPVADFLQVAQALEVEEPPQSHDLPQESRLAETVVQRSKQSTMFADSSSDQDSGDDNDPALDTEDESLDVVDVESSASDRESAVEEQPEETETISPSTAKAESESDDDKEMVLSTMGSRKRKIPLPTFSFNKPKQTAIDAQEQDATAQKKKQKVKFNSAPKDTPKMSTGGSQAKISFDPYSNLVIDEKVRYFNHV
jgi:hypothetical protein